MQAWNVGTSDLPRRYFEGGEWCGKKSLCLFNECGLWCFCLCLWFYYYWFIYNPRLVVFDNWSELGPLYSMIWIWIESGVRCIRSLDLSVIWIPCVESDFRRASWWLQYLSTQADATVGDGDTTLRRLLKQGYALPPPSVLCCSVTCFLLLLMLRFVQVWLLGGVVSGRHEWGGEEEGACCLLLCYCDAVQHDLCGGCCSGRSALF